MYDPMNFYFPLRTNEALGFYSGGLTGAGQVIPNQVDFELAINRSRKFGVKLKSTGYHWTVR
jgi:hypothetical protein